MKKNAHILAFVLLALPLCTACDLFRALADRPLARDVERMEVDLKRHEDAARQARLDSAARYAAECAAADSSSAAAAPAATVAASKVTASAETKGNASSAASAAAPAAPAPVKPRPPQLRRYYVSLGCYGSSVNAERLADRARQAGYEVVCVTFASGKTLVKACPTEDRAEADAALVRLRGESFCPKDAVVIDRVKR